jgi:N-acetylglucosaminyldiphosphoundecaprenol N-acetyl-beta-D-mannosaminyltransferase
VSEVSRTEHKINVLGIEIDNISLDEILGRIEKNIVGRKRTIITHIHVKGLNIAYQQDWFREYLNSSDINFCEGKGVKLAARWLGYKNVYVHTFADWIDQLAGLAEFRGFSFFFLGNPPGIALRATQVLQAKFPKLKIAGTYHGYFNKQSGHPENEVVVKMINAAQPDILMVGFGMPIQEKWTKENWHRLDAEVVIMCGALPEYIAGTLPRAPKWMTENYLEWLGRIIISPRRYWKRYLIDNSILFFHILKNKLTKHS